MNIFRWLNDDQPLSNKDKNRVKMLFDHNVPVIDCVIILSDLQEYKIRECYWDCINE